MARLVALVTDRAGPMFARSTLAELVLVSTLAALAEEALFRGVLQSALGAHLPAWAAVLAASALFGLAHFLTPLYALVAAIVGIYFGLLLVLGGNLLVPIVAHGLYDVVALRALQRAFTLTQATGHDPTHPLRSG
jgi:membrane protease YdiL (CAAX protease family)